MPSEQEFQEAMKGIDIQSKDMVEVVSNVVKLLKVGPLAQFISYLSLAQGVAKMSLESAKNPEALVDVITGMLDLAKVELERVAHAANSEEGRAALHTAK